MRAGFGVQMEGEGYNDVVLLNGLSEINRVILKKNHSLTVVVTVVIFVYEYTLVSVL